MKKLLAILMVLVISVMAIPALVSAGAPTYLTLVLDNKNPDTWVRIDDGMSGLLYYGTSGDKFDYSFTATGLVPSDNYSLIYYANPWPGNNPGKLINTATADSFGAISIPAFGGVELGMDLPTAPDANMVMAYNVPPNSTSAKPHGAKIWLVPTACYNAATNSIISWEPTRFLFETDLITYIDTNKTGGSVAGLTTTVTEPVATVSFTLDPTNILFGPVAIGACSSSHIITITNTGNTPIIVTAAPSAGFYTTSLKLGPTGSEIIVPIGGWKTGKIAALGGITTISAIVCPLPGLSGTQTGTLTFIAEFAQ